MDEEQLQQAMQDPKIRAQMEAYEKAMQDPAVQGQMQQMAQVMQNEEVQKRMASLKDDPELKPMFDDIQKNGMTAMMKYMNDPTWLAKVGERLGDVGPGLAASQPPAAAAAAPQEEVTNIIQAAKAGDLEAVEDFIAIGKDVNERDDEGRSALHYAVAYKREAVFQELMASGADTSIEDSKGNSPLHYAAGYGRSEFVKDLIDAGAKGFSKNSSGHRPFDLVKMEKRNPLNNDPELMRLLEVSAK